jgi:putative hydrolase of the HAD superfamily
MPPIRTIFFDVGGVLLTNGWDRLERKSVFDHFGIECASVEERHAASNDAWERGDISVWEYLDHTVFFQPRDFTPQQFFEAMQQQSAVLTNSALEVLETLAARKIHKRVMLNNESAELNDYRIQQFNLAPLFDSFLCSAYVAMRKPDVRMFQMALQVTQTAPESAVFIDDRKENCDGARKAGMHAIQYDSPEQLTSELRDLSVDL